MKKLAAAAAGLILGLCPATVFAHGHGVTQNKYQQKHHHRVSQELFQHVGTFDDTQGIMLNVTAPLLNQRFRRGF